VIFTAFHSYTPHACYSLVGRESIVYGSPLKYEFFIADNNGNLQMKIQKDEKLYPISKREKNKIIEELEESISVRGRKWPKQVLEEACKFPAHRPFFKNILVDEKQRIYLLRVLSVFEEENKVVIDVFSKKGFYLYKIKVPHNPEIIRYGYFYELFASEESGEEKIKRYKVKNWKEIKEGI